MDIVLKGIVFKDTNSLDFYLDALCESSNKKEKNFEQIVELISSLLSKSKTRDFGLHTLNRIFHQLPNNLFEQKANLWISQIFKSFSENKERTNAGKVYTLLGKFCEKSLISTDISRSFTTNHLTKIFELLLNVSPYGNLEALKCIETCLRLYPTPCRSFKSVILAYLQRFIDVTDKILICWTAKCLHLLQQIRTSNEDSRNLSQKGVWEDYQNKLLGSINDILNITFEKHPNLYEQTSIQDHLTLSKLNLSAEPIARSMQLYIRFENLVTYLIFSIREPFPAKKAIHAKKILGLILRCLSIPSKVVQDNTTDNIALKMVLPKIHHQLLKLLEVLLITLRTHLKMYYHSIMNIITQSLKNQSLKLVGSGLHPNLLLRAKTYDLLSLWCSITGCGSRVNQIAELVIEEILLDICPVQSSLTLKVEQDGKKGTAKKSRRKANAQNLETTNKSEPPSEMKILVCLGALRCLQQILSTSTNFLNAPTIKALQIKLIETCSVIYSKNVTNEHVYANGKCRSELFNVLYILVIAPHHYCPPPIDLIMSILRRSQHLDGMLLVRTNCAQILLNLEKLIHSQKQSLMFPKEFREIKNAFSKYGRENLLSTEIFESSEIELSNNEINETAEELSDIDREDTILENDNSQILEATEDTDDFIDNLNDDDKISTNDEAEILTTTVQNNQIDNDETSLIEQDKGIEEESDKISNDGSVIVTKLYHNRGKHSNSILESNENLEDLHSPKKQKMSDDIENVTELSQKETGSLSDDILLADLEASFVNELN